jgi:hypothetical protein
MNIRADVALAVAAVSRTEFPDQSNAFGGGKDG